MGQIQQQVLGAIRSSRASEVVQAVSPTAALKRKQAEVEDLFRMAEANKRAAQKQEARLAGKRIASYLNSRQNTPIGLESPQSKPVLSGLGEDTVYPKDLKAGAREYMKQKGFGEYAQKGIYNKARVANALAYLELHNKTKESIENKWDTKNREELKKLEEDEE